ncbi:MAG TPA: hypothetical protein VGV14_02045 [Rhodanobacter sp.]|nr:hypothetical protein [Rhodanobacter sp.]
MLLLIPVTITPLKSVTDSADFFLPFLPFGSTFAWLGSGGVGDMAAGIVCC